MWPQTALTSPAARTASTRSRFGCMCPRVATTVPPLCLRVTAAWRPAERLAWSQEMQSCLLFFLWPTTAGQADKDRRKKIGSGLAGDPACQTWDYNGPTAHPCPTAFETEWAGICCSWDDGLTRVCWWVDDRQHDTSKLHCTVDCRPSTLRERGRCTCMQSLYSTKLPLGKNQD